MISSVSKQKLIASLNRNIHQILSATHSLRPIKLKAIPEVAKRNYLLSQIKEIISERFLMFPSKMRSYSKTGCIWYFWKIDIESACPDKLFLDKWSWNANKKLFNPHFNACCWNLRQTSNPKYSITLNLLTWNYYQ